MTTVLNLIKRNTKLFFKDKGMFFTSLITPMILLVLYGTFLGKVFKDSFIMSIPQGFALPEKVINGFVSGQLCSSILAVSCITVAFCSNMLMVQDKSNGSIKDFAVSPVNPSKLSIGYYISSVISTGIVCFTAAVLCLVYMGISGFYMSFTDVLLLSADIFILVLMGTAASSIINYFLSTQGQISAVGTIVSSVYGFICGAYMPISQFADGLQKVIMFIPGTYGTSLLRRHALSGVLEELKANGIPDIAVDKIADSVDCNLYFFEHKVSESAMYAVVIGTVILLIGIYILMNLKRKKAK